MATDLQPYTIRGEKLSTWNVTDTPGLRELLEHVEQDAFEAGREAGEKSMVDSCQDDVTNALKDLAHELTPLLEQLLDVIHDYARNSITPPDAHELALTSLRNQIVNVLDDIDPEGTPR